MSESSKAFFAKAAVHFSDENRHKLEIPELGMTVFWSPLTLTELSTFKARAGDADDPADSVEIVIMKCKDENGEKMFAIGDKTKLLNNVDSKIVQRIAMSIIVSTPSMAEIEKN